LADHSKVYTTKLDYLLDLPALAADYYFILVAQLNQDTYAEFYRLLDQWDTVAVVSVKRNKLVMAASLPQLPTDTGLVFTRLGLEPEERRTNGVFDNHLLSLLLNQQTASETLPALPTKTSSLLIVRNSWVWLGRDQLRRCYALQVTINWQNDLQLKVQTFTETNTPDLKKPRYVLDQKRQCLYQCRPQMKTPVFVKGSTTTQHHQVPFLAMDTLVKFENSKVGIATAILKRLNANAIAYLKQHVAFHASTVVAAAHLKLPEGKNIWQQLATQPLNIYTLPGDTYTQELATRIYQALQKSELIQAAQLQVVQGQAAINGWNIQIVRDVRGKPQTDDYQLGDARQVIQHATVEAFGQYDPETRNLKWSPSKKDPAGDAGLIKLAQELLIKRDVYSGRLQAVSPELAKITQIYTFYSFEFLPEAEMPTVMLLKMTVDSQLQLHFSERLFNLAHLEAEDEDTILCKAVYDKIGKKTNAYAWENVACVVASGTQQVLIQRMDRVTMPSGARIYDDLKKSNLEQEWTREAFLAELNQMQAYVSTVDGSEAALAQLQAIIKALQPAFSLKTVDQALRKVGLGPRQKGMQRLNQLLEQHAPFTFRDTLQRHLPDSPLAGLVGIGLIQIENKWQYFVGANQSLKRNIPRALVLRCLQPLHDGPDVIEPWFEKLAQLMSVEFVHNGQYTVLPYPAKYLREHWLYQQRWRHTKN
jgi:hypothetical protein